MRWWSFHTEKTTAPYLSDSWFWAGRSHTGWHRVWKLSLVWHRTPTSRTHTQNKKLQFRISFNRSMHQDSCDSPKTPSSANFQVYSKQICHSTATLKGETSAHSLSSLLPWNPCLLRALHSNQTLIKRYFSFTVLLTAETRTHSHIQPVYHPHPSPQMNRHSLHWFETRSLRESWGEFDITGCYSSRWFSTRQQHLEPVPLWDVSCYIKSN